MATIRDVALLAGVSMTTVSHVINATRPVSASAVRKVNAAVEATGYEPSAIARSLRRRETYTVGIIVTDIRNSFYTQVVRGIEDVLHRHDYNAMLCNSDEDTAKQDHYLRLLSSKRVDGLIVVPTVGRSSVLSALMDRGIPVVFLDRRPTGIAGPFVGIDSMSAAEHAVSHLIEHGHRRIALVAGRPSAQTTSERRQGYSRALAAHGLSVDDRLLKLYGTKVEVSRASTRELLALDPRPDAIFATNNDGLLGVVLGLRDASVRIPTDVAVMGFDNLPWAEALDPPLTVVHQPMYELGERAGAMLLSRLKGEQLPASEVLLPTHLLTRGSCGESCLTAYRPAASDAKIAVEIPEPSRFTTHGSAHAIGAVG